MKSSLSYCVVIIGVLLQGLWSTSVSGESRINVNEEIERVEGHLKTIKPTPELIGAVLQQLEQHCHGKGTKKIDQTTLTNVSQCMEKHMNETQLISDIKKSIPEGQLDTVFHDTCLKWPKIKACMNDLFVVIDECWDGGDKVTKVVDEAIKFFCGDDDDGARIALFLAEGGMECLEQHGDHVKSCVESRQEKNLAKLPDNLDGGLPDLPDKLPGKDDICEALTDMMECTSKELRRCKDPTPENLATSMIRYVAKAVKCTIKEDRGILGKPQQISGASRNFDVSRGLEFAALIATGVAFIA